MFNEKQINAYKNITAPKELREKVLISENQPTVSEKTSSMKVLRNISVIAACIVIIIAITFIADSYNQVSVFMNGAELSKDYTALENVQSAFSLAQISQTDNLEIPLKIKLKGETQISVNDGIILTDENESGSKKLVKENDIQIIWSIEADREKEYTLEVASANNTCTVMLIFDNAENCWKISCNK